MQRVEEEQGEMKTMGSDFMQDFVEENIGLEMDIVRDKNPMN